MCPAQRATPPAHTRPPASFAREVLSSHVIRRVGCTMSAAELGAAGSSAEPSVLGKKALGAEHLAANLSAERKKRQKSGALPSIPAISLTAMLDGDDDAPSTAANASTTSVSSRVRGMMIPPAASPS